MNLREKKAHWPNFASFCVDAMHHVINAAEHKKKTIRNLYEKHINMPTNSTEKNTKFNIGFVRPEYFRTQANGVALSVYHSGRSN